MGPSSIIGLSFHRHWVKLAGQRLPKQTSNAFDRAMAPFLIRKIGKSLLSLLLSYFFAAPAMLFDGFATPEDSLPFLLFHTVFMVSCSALFPKKILIWHALCVSFRQRKRLFVNRPRGKPFLFEMF